jgi:hypothetical protein
MGPCGCKDEDCTIVVESCDWKFTDANEYLPDSPWTGPPGTMWWTRTTLWHEGPNGEIRCPAGWTNCDGQHLFVMLPDNSPFDCMSRAGNCGLKEDTVHRCWQVTGTPPQTTLGKGEPTCPAGASSILTPEWHGFLRDGTLVVA